LKSVLTLGLYFREQIAYFRIKVVLRVLLALVVLRSNPLLHFENVPNRELVPQLEDVAEDLFDDLLVDGKIGADLSYVRRNAFNKLFLGRDVRRGVRAVTAACFVLARRIHKHLNEKCDCQREMKVVAKLDDMLRVLLNTINQF